MSTNYTPKAGAFPQIDYEDLLHEICDRQSGHLQRFKHANKDAEVLQAEIAALKNLARAALAADRHAHDRMIEYRATRRYR